ncbi:hypothetical protein MRB53_022898 [Persea americana]|uniref:Uncharacterized protein n=1 Tax=Persea americana TaxID=3435 RepID=A0ACC2L8A3_PERAE|nr:hypothetical protein MRB53_022898 [Persea americana]
MRENFKRAKGVSKRRSDFWECIRITRISGNVCSFEVGAVLEDAKWQAPYYCFEKKEEKTPKPESFRVPNTTVEGMGHKRVRRGLKGL